MSGNITDNVRTSINRSLSEWRQGDIVLDAGLESFHLAYLSQPNSPASIQVATRLEHEGTPLPDDVTPIMVASPGLVMVSQTCDVVRDCMTRPFVEVAPLVELSERTVEEVKRLKRPAFAYVPATANRRLVADLDRPMAVEKAIVARWNRVPGWTDDQEIHDFALALSRKRARYAFPDDFVRAAQGFQKRLVEKHNRQTSEGSHLRALREIRVRAAPSWNDERVQLSWWFIKERDPESIESDWHAMVESWLCLFDQNRRFETGQWTACRLEDMTARDYVESVRLDLDQLSVAR